MVRVRCRSVTKGEFIWLLQITVWRLYFGDTCWQICNLLMYVGRLKSSWTGGSAPLLWRWRHKNTAAVHCRQSTNFSKGPCMFGKTKCSETIEPKKDEVGEQFRTLYNEIFRYLHRSANFLRTVKSRRVMWAGHAARWGLFIEVWWSNILENGRLEG
jgi:hypothetical protein